MFSWLRNQIHNLLQHRSEDALFFDQRAGDHDDAALIYEFLVDNSREAIFWTDDAGRFVSCNDATCTMLGYTRNELQQMSVRDIDADITDESHAELLQTLTDSPSVSVQAQPQRKDGTYVTMEFTVTRAQIAGRVYLCTYSREIDLERQLRDRVLKSLATDSSLSATLRLIVELAETTRRGMLGSILLLDDEGRLQHAAAPQLEDTYRRQIDGIRPGPEAGSFGAAVFHERTVLVRDISDSSEWSPLRETAERAGLHACWAEPITSKSNEVLGVLAMYFNAPKAPTPMDRKLLKTYAHMTGIAVERAAENEQLFKSELRNRSLVQSSAATIWTTSANGEFAVPQPSWEAYTGQPWELHQGTGWMEAIHPDDRERVADQWKVALSTSEPFGTYVRVWHANSASFRHCEAHVAPVIVNHEVIEWFGSTTDVSDIKETEQALRQSERQLRTITDSLPVMIAYVDTDYCFQFNNAMYEIRLGKSRNEMMGQSISQILGQEQFEEARPYFEETFRGAETKFECQREYEDGSRRTMDVRLVPDRNSVGEIVGAYAMLDDITGRRALEKEVLNAATEEQRRIGQDLHDGTGQELTGLGMLADALVLSLTRTGADERHIAEKMAAGVKRALRQVKSVARGLNPVDVAAEGLMSAILQMSEHVESLYQIQVVFECDEAVVLSDNQLATQLFRIAQEASTNAARHGHASTVTIKLEESEGELVLSVSDDGTGINKARMDDQGMGIRTMKYRAGVIGGTLEIANNPSGGTQVTCRVIRKRHAPGISENVDHSPQTSRPSTTDLRE